MKFLTYLLFCAGLIGMTPRQPSIPKMFEKKVNKMLKKIWKTNDISLENALLPGFPKGMPNRYFYSLKKEGKLVGILSINMAHGCQIGGCQANGFHENSTMEDARYENFWYAVIFKPDLTIMEAKVLDYESEYGYEICGKNWLKQFRGFKGCDLQYGSKEVDAISGATVSGQSIVTDINNLCWLLHDLPFLKKDSVVTRKD